MKRLIVFVIMILLMVLDNAFCPFIGIKGVVPSLLFIFSIAYSIIHGKEEAIIIGVVSGILQDIYFINGFGVNTLVNMYCCFVAAIIGESIWKEKKIVPTITMFGISALKYYSVYLILYIIGINIDSFRGIFIAIYNSIIMFFIYKIAFKHLKDERNETSWRFK